MKIRTIKRNNSETCNRGDKHKKRLITMPKQSLQAAISGPTKSPAYNFVHKLGFQNPLYKRRLFNQHDRERSSWVHLNRILNQRKISNITPPGLISVSVGFDGLVDSHWLLMWTVEHLVSEWLIRFDLGCLYFR